LQPREKLRGEDGEIEKHGTNTVHGVWRGFSGCNKLPFGAFGRVQRVDRRLRSCQPVAPALDPRTTQIKRFASNARWRIQILSPHPNHQIPPYLFQIQQIL